MATKTIQTNVVIVEKEELFFKEVEFDFDALPQENSFMWQTPNIASRLFMIQNVDEKIQVKAYPTRDKAIMFNAWITKNISYKIAKQVPKQVTSCCLPTEVIGCQGMEGIGPFPPMPTPEIETVGIGMKDSEGYPTVYGPLYHMTKVIDFGGFIELDLPEGEVLKDTDKVEVLSAEIVGTHDELLDPEPIYEPYQSNAFTMTNQEVVVLIPPGPDDPPGTLPKPAKVIVQIPTAMTKYREFDPPLNQYARLREKMCIKIKVKVVRTEHISIETEE